MPQISFFYGIIILMNFSDHAPAHFHAWYGDYKIIVSIKDGIVKGEMVQSKNIGKDLKETIKN